MPGLERTSLIAAPRLATVSGTVLAEQDDVALAQGRANIAPTAGFSFSRPVPYLSTEPSDPLSATLECATCASDPADIAVGADDSVFSAVGRFFVAVNCPIVFRFL